MSQRLIKCGKKERTAAPEVILDEPSSIIILRVLWRDPTADARFVFVALGAL